MAIKSLFLDRWFSMQICPPATTGQCLETVLIVRTGVSGVPSTSSGWSLGMLLNILWCPRQPHNRVSGVTKNVSSAVVEQSWSYIPPWQTALSNKPSIFARTMGSFSLIPTIAESKMVTSLKHALQFVSGNVEISFSQYHFLSYPTLTGPENCSAITLC